MSAVFAIRLDSRDLRSRYMRIMLSHGRKTTSYVNHIVRTLAACITLLDHQHDGQSPALAEHNNALTASRKRCDVGKDMKEQIQWLASYTPSISADNVQIQAYK